MHSLQLIDISTSSAIMRAPDKAYVVLDGLKAKLSGNASSIEVAGDPSK